MLHYLKFRFKQKFGGGEDEHSKESSFLFFLEKPDLKNNRKKSTLII